MDTLRLPVVNVQTVAANAIFIQVARGNYSFEPGQYAYVAVTKKKYQDSDGHMRILSFASAPNDSTVDFLVRFRPSGYKQELAELQPGDEIEIHRPIGNFSFHDLAVNVSIAGGVGIAPFLSLIKSGLSRGVTPPLTLIWSNQSVESTPLFEEISNYMSRWPASNFYPLLTRQGVCDLPFMAARVTPHWLKSQHTINRHAYYLISGPTGLTSDLSDFLTTVGTPGGHIKIEAFSGY